MFEDNPLTDLRQTIHDHWTKYRPRMCADLVADGKLDAAIEEAARRTEQAVLDLTSRGVPLLEAWVQIREEWAILPAEEDDEPEEPSDGYLLWDANWPDEDDEQPGDDDVERPNGVGPEKRGKAEL